MGSNGSKTTYHVVIYRLLIFNNMEGRHLSINIEDSRTSLSVILITPFGCGKWRYCHESCYILNIRCLSLLKKLERIQFTE